jgi:hypothetical protein
MRHIAVVGAGTSGQISLRPRLVELMLRNHG